MHVVSFCCLGRIALAAMGTHTQLLNDFRDHEVPVGIVTKV